MRLRVLDLPDDPAELAPWLDRQLVGLGLGEVVAELEAVHARTASGSSPSLDALLTEHLPAVLDVGLSAAPRASLTALLKHPRLLLDLQERVLLEGGAYWDELSREDGETVRAVAAVWTGLERALWATPAPAKAEPVVTPFRPRRRDLLVRVWASLATAAALMLAWLYVVERFAPTDRPPQVVDQQPSRGDPSWGWTRPALLGHVEPPPVYLNRLADAADEWFRKRPDDPAALARRIGEFRLGCSVLILAPHAPLPPADRDWLVGRCRAWAAKLDRHLADVEAGVNPIKVRGEVDETVKRLIQALRGRAEAAA